MGSETIKGLNLCFKVEVIIVFRLELRSGG